MLCNHVRRSSCCSLVVDGGRWIAQEKEDTAAIGPQPSSIIDHAFSIPYSSLQMARSSSLCCVGSFSPGSLRQFVEYLAGISSWFPENPVASNLYNWSCQGVPSWSQSFYPGSCFRFQMRMASRWSWWIMKKKCCTVINKSQLSFWESQFTKSVVIFSGLGNFLCVSE